MLSGVAFFWPTMLGFVSENIPESGALGLAIMGGIGFLGGAIAQPVLGAIFDAQTVASVPAGQVIEVLKSAAEGTKEAADMGHCPAKRRRPYFTLCCDSACISDNLFYIPPHEETGLTPPQSVYH